MGTLGENDQDHLRLLGIFHYIVGGLAALFSLFPLIHVAIGWFLTHAPPPSHGEPPPAFIGWLFMAFGGAFFLIGETLAACIIAAGRCLQHRKHYGFVFGIACVECLFMPFGTVLGVFTIIVLSRPSVKQLFGQPG
jgi:hypothetical protein